MLATSIEVTTNTEEGAKNYDDLIQPLLFCTTKIVTRFSQFPLFFLYHLNQNANRKHSIEYNTYNIKSIQTPRLYQCTVSHGMIFKHFPRTNTNHEQLLFNLQTPITDQTKNNVNMELIRTKRKRISVRDLPFHIPKDLFSISEEDDDKNSFCCKDKEEEKLSCRPSCSLIA